MTMASKLLDLPNELFPFIFQHLTSAQLIQAFFHRDSFRLQALIEPFVVHLDISRQTDLWVQTYLPELVRQYSIDALRLQDEQIPQIVDQLLAIDVPCLHILSSDWTTDILKQAIDQLRGRVKKLGVTFVYSHGKGDIARHVFHSESSLEYLSVTGRFLFFDPTEIETCSRLTHLTIELEGMNRLFALLKHLPNLEDLKVNFRNEERLIQPEVPVLDATPCDVLRRVTFTGCTRNFDHVESFFGSFGSTIECLSINLDLLYCTVNGHELEDALLNEMPRLSSLNLIIHSTAVFSEPIKISTLQSVAWQRFHPLVHWHDRHAHQQTMFTVPYLSDRFKYLSNEFLTSWTPNRPVSLSFERVHCLSLSITTPFTLATFQLIEKLFPNVATLEFINPLTFVGLDYDDEYTRHSSYLNEDLLANATLQLPSITKFCLKSLTQYDDYRTFHRLIHLLPNLVTLQMYIGRSLFRQVLANEHDDASVKTALARIDFLHMVRFYDEKNVLTNEEIYSLFPHARILFDYDEF